MRAYLNGGGVDVELLEDGECLLVQFARDCDVGNVGRVVVVQSSDVLHHARSVSLDRRQDEQVLKIPAQKSYNHVIAT